jgi:integrase
VSPVRVPGWHGELHLLLCAASHVADLRPREHHGGDSGFSGLPGCITRIRPGLFAGQQASRAGRERPKVRGTPGEYAQTWIGDQVLKPRTEELYRGLFKNHLSSAFGKVDLRDIHESDVRRWRKERLATGPAQERPFGPVTVAKAYRLLNAILNTATDDRLIRRNPCRIKGAGQEDSPERAVISLATLVELLDRVALRYRALVLLATFASLRFGELARLRRRQLDLDGYAVRVVIATAETDDGRLIDDDPKSQAGWRRVAFPKEIAPELRWHLERFAQPGDDGLVFIGPKGGRLRRSTFRRTWTKARTAIGLPDLHFHDLRHTGNTMAAGQGASLRELMERMGHSSARAALIYQHATQERDEAIAAGMGKLLRQAQRKARAAGEAGTELPSGTQRARGRKRAS